MSLASNVKGQRLLELSTKNKRKFIDSFESVVLSCDGLLWYLSDLIPNSGNAINLLIKVGKSLKFVVKYSEFSDEYYIANLEKLGIKNFKNDDIIHPIKIIIPYLKRMLPNQSIFSLCSYKVNILLQNSGIKIVTMKPSTDIRSGEILSRLNPGQTVHKVAAVLYDLNLNITYDQLAKAQQYLQDETCQLLVGSSDSSVQLSANLYTIGTRGFINILHTTTGKDPIILGKPGRLMSEGMIHQFKLFEPKNVLYIGCDLRADIEFGVMCGFQTLFVTCDKPVDDEMATIPIKYRPDFIINQLTDFRTFFQQMFKTQ